MSSSPSSSSFLKKTHLFLRFFTYALSTLFQNLSHTLSATLHRLLYKPLPAAADQSSRQNVVIVGASFAGYYAAQFLATSLPPTHRVVVVEPHSHFHFTWVFPRLAAGGTNQAGHEHEAFIPYGPHLRRAPKDAVVWKRDKVERVGRESVVLRGGEEVRYAYLLVATGSSAGPPSRMVGAEGKGEGVAVLRGVRERVEGAGNVVVVGGGAVGVEVATDAKSAWPEKKVTLVHSREVVLGRFGPELRKVAMETMEGLGVEVVLGERVKDEGKGEGVVTLSSGRVLPCDYLIGCTGQKPVSGILMDISPSSISPSGHIRVKPTMQLADDSLPNVYAAGDVADTDAQKANARSAMKQAKVAADNILLAIKGQQPRNQYKYVWQDGAILLTLGLHKAVVNISDDETEMNIHTKGKDMSLHAASGWKHMGVKPFDDDYEAEKTLEN